MALATGQSECYRTMPTLSRGVEEPAGPTGLQFALLTMTQFHLTFWVSRTLPSMFALCPNTSVHL